MYQSPLPIQLPIDTSLTPTLEELEEALCILTHIHLEDPSKLKQIMSKLAIFAEFRQPDFLTFNDPLRKMLIKLYKVPEKVQGNRALYRKVVSKIYCYNGNMFGKLKAYIKQYQLPFKANEHEFRATVIGIITEAYRSIEERVVKNFEVLEIKPLDQRQVKEIEPILMNLEGNMCGTNAEVFKQEIKNIFCLEKAEEIDLTLCYQFYHQLREKMEARQAELSPQSRILENSPLKPAKDKDIFQPDYQTYEDWYYDLTGYKEIPKHHYVKEDNPDIWTPLVQQQIVALFLEFGDYARIREKFIRKYGMHDQLTDVGRIKRKLIKIIRGTVRLLQQFYNKHMNDTTPPLPKMIEIDEDKVKLLIGSPYEIKACLLEFYRQTIMSYRIVCELINDINVFIREKSLLRFQKSTASKAIIFSL